MVDVSLMHALLKIKVLLDAIQRICDALNEWLNYAIAVKKHLYI